MASTARTAFLALFVLSLASVFPTGCAQQLEDIDRTQPNRLAKADLDGVWYYMETVTEVPATSVASFEGETSRTEKVVFVIEENLLLAYRAYPLVPGSDDVDGNYDYGAPDYHEGPVAAFPILSHFDIQRQYNDATGEQTNVIVEDTADRPWYEREYVRVDWSRNLVSNFDFLTEWFSTPIEGSYQVDAERGGAQAIYFERDASDELVYFDVPRQLLVEPDFWGCMYAWWGLSIEDCSGAQVELVSSFARTERRRDYEPLPYDDRELTRFGYFRSERTVYDPQRGALEANRSRMANRFNLWAQSYERDETGAFAVDTEGRLLPIPLAEREVRTIPYYVNATFPDDPLIWDAAVDTMAQWNDVGREAAALAQGSDPQQVGDVFVLCHNPVEDGDPEACGEPGFTVRPGDLRYSTLYWIESEQLLGPLGYGPAAIDPETGEVISGRAYIYGAALGTYVSRAVDIIRLTNGDLEGVDLVESEHVREAVLARGRDAENLARVDERLRDLPIEGPRRRDPERMAQREARRRSPRPFDRGAAERRLEQAREAGITSGLGGVEYQRSLAAHLGRRVDDIDAATLAEFDPTAYLTPLRMRERQQQRQRAMARGLDFADMVSPNVLGIAAAYQGRTDYDQIWRELRAEVFRSVALHEVGHTVGLRHNFQGTFDSLNYHDEYWALRGPELFEPTSMFDMYALSAVTEAQHEGRMLEYAYSSIMDYGLDFNTDIHGLGRYDRAAFIYAHSAGTATVPSDELDGACTGEGRWAEPGNAAECRVRRRGFVEVFEKNAEELGEIGEILTSRDEMGQRYDDPTTPNFPYLERWHYTTVMNAFPERDDAFARRWMNMEDYLATRGDESQRTVRVPYLFCGDEWLEALVSCQVYDAGADPFEQTRAAIDQYRAYYWFTNFSRDRFGWEDWAALDYAFYYTFLPLSNYFQAWYLAPYGFDTLYDDYFWLAINAGMNTIAEAIATPAYGTYCTTPDGELVNLNDEAGLDPAINLDYYLAVYCEQDPDYFEIRQGDGRRPFTAYNVDSGYYFGFLPREAGHYWTTLAAFWALTDPEAYVLGSDADLGSYSISYYDYFPDEIHRLVNDVLTEDFSAYSPVLEVNDDSRENPTGRLRYPVIAPVYDSERAVLFNPETGEAVDTILGPSRGVTPLYARCDSNEQCNGYTGNLGDIWCSYVDDPAVNYCLQDCSDDDTLCGDDEVCNDIGNCVPDDGDVRGRVADCGPEDPHGACPEQQTCDDGSCVDLWPVVQTDATFMLQDDMIFYGMFYTTFSYSTRYNDQLNVFRMGTDEELEPGEGFQVVEFTDPISGERYGAVAEDCDPPEGAPLGGSSSLCDACDFDDECPGYTGDYGGVFCSPMRRLTDETWYCLQDCTLDADLCGPGFACSRQGTCLPRNFDCSVQTGECSAENPLGSCPFGATCVEGACVENSASARCVFGQSDLSGAARLVLMGQELAQRYDETLAAYWNDPGDDEARETQLYYEFSDAQYRLENLVSKLNAIRATFRLFGRVY